MSNGASSFFPRIVLCLLATGACASPAGTNRVGGTNNGGNSSVGGNGSGASVSGGGTAGSGPVVRIPTEVSPGCGNNMQDANEECDDGNKMGGDGCAASCRVETDWQCPQVGPCTKTAVCGDGRLASTEVCDDGNTNPGDGCSANCGAVEDGYQCRVPGKKCVPLCGDRKITATEDCDDGNAMSGDGCSSTCLTEPGWSCDPATGKCTQSECGNGIPEAGETCDKGMENGLFFGDATGCSKTCTQEPNCREGGKTQACKTPCGDSNIDPGEDCDDGNQVDGDGCSKECKVEAGFTCQAEEHKDTQQCSTGTGECLVLPIIYRDFDGENVANTGHPDFFYLGAGFSQCVPNASGQTDPTPITADTCWTTDSTDLCQGLLQPTLGADGKPTLGPAKMCACRFTDWDAPNIIPAGMGQSCTVPDDGTRQRIQTMVSVIKSADTFNQWYHDGTGGTNGTKFVDKLELALLSGNQYQFSSSNGRTVYDDLHDIFMGTGPAVSLTSGFFPEVLEQSPRAKVCNLWPYWAPNTNCVAATGAQPSQQWDPLGSTTAGMAGTGGPVTPVTGVKRNFYFTSEVRYLFRFVGGETLSFYGDDDVWVFVNGQLALDLGAPHERLQGTVTLPAAGGGGAGTWAIQAKNNTTGMNVAIKSGMTPALGLEVGKTYEIAVFHADRHPRESNYQLTLSGFSTSRSNCAPRCGDGVVTAAEECDEGPMNVDGVYGGCTTQCKFGPFCGDGNTDASGEEECDAGRDNGATYGQMGCTAGCKIPHRCGDALLDGDQGEECDDGANNGVGNCDVTCHLTVK